MGDSLQVFGFGSLIFAPEAPEHCQRKIPAVLHGYHRDFNKRSRARSCPTALSHDVFPDVSPQFRVDGVNYSLALGTVEDPSSQIEGVVLQYPSDVRDDVLEATDLREGYDPHRQDVENGYLRISLPVTTGEGDTKAWVYLSNPDPDCIYFVSSEMGIEEKAQILINATPASGESVPGRSDVRGLYYLEGVRRGLLSIGIVDPTLEQISAAVLSFDGPWCDWVAIPGDAVSSGNGE